MFKPPVSNSLIHLHAYPPWDVPLFTPDAVQTKDVSELISRAERDERLRFALSEMIYGVQNPPLTESKESALAHQLGDSDFGIGGMAGSGWWALDLPPQVTFRSVEGSAVRDPSFPNWAEPSFFRLIESLPLCYQS